MQTAKLKTYAPKARRDFIAAVTRRAAKFGLTAKGASQVREEGQLVFIEGQPYPRSVGAQRAKLAARIQQQSFQQVMEAAAYTWFNRFAAIRFMELHGYLDHSFRVLSPSPLAGEGRGEGASSTGLPEILEQAQHVDLPGLDRQRVIELKMDGTRDEELYRDLLLAQCRALHQAMPFLFESVDDETELLLPENLLQTDSLIRELVTAIPEDDWQEIEIIGWLYQFYISEKKDQVIGKVVKSEDIPAATQLFTPNWIVKYMVQNSLGAQWLATYPDSPLKGQMAYYIEPAEQTEEVKAQLAAITPDSLNPEELTLIDPACGSGHILVEAYDLFKAIYLERGYRQRDVARLILEMNLFGLDIDGRAAQLTGFALMMKGRADDRRLLERGVTLNVMALQESKGLDADELIRSLETVVGRVSPQGVTRQSNAEFGVDDLFPGTLPQMRLGESETAQTSGYAARIRPTITALIETFAEAKTFGSLIQIAPELAAALPKMEGELSQALETGDAFARAAAEDLLRLVRQARVLAMRFDAVVANPPYMGSRYYDASLKRLVEKHYKVSKGDLYTCFIMRNIIFSKISGSVGMITIPNWMFLSTFEELRDWLFKEATIDTFSHNGRGVFGSDFGSCALTLRHYVVYEYKGRYKRLFEKQGSVASNSELADRFLAAKTFDASTADFRKIPGYPIAYWISDKIRKIFAENRSMGEMVDAKQSLATADNDRFLRMWQEVNFSHIGFGLKSRDEARLSQKKWFPHQKGGDFRKWYGNHEWLVNWEKDGEEIRNFKDDDGKVKSRPQGTDYYFRECLSWSDVTSASNAFRYDGSGFIPNVIAPAIFKKDVDLRLFLLAANNVFYNFVSKVLNPTIHFHVGYFTTLPFPEKLLHSDLSIADELVAIAKKDWDSSEVSWAFQQLPWLSGQRSEGKLSVAWNAWSHSQKAAINRMKELEEQNNRLFIEAYELQDEFSPEVPEDQITLTCTDREKDCQRLISYAIGCMMGRYSLDAPGLIYAHSGNQDFDPSRYARFPADADGILPITDTDWFDEDAAHRLVEFIAVAWNPTHLEENLSFLAANLSPKNGESSRETIRRYLSDRFFKDHLQTYKNRPIYWCFSSGKQKAFQCLVYLHRYNEGTLAQMRMEYVVPLQGKMAARIDKLGDDIQAASSSAQAKRLQKERDQLAKQLEELRRYDEQLRHYADQRIALDLDDGVKVNYAKFGNLLAEVKTVTGTNPD